MNNGIQANINELLAMRYYATNIQLFNRLKVATPQIGNRLSSIKGRGMDFDEVRRYQAGDDIRLIHWQLSARLGKTYTKVYKEERERQVYLLIDQSHSMHFGTKVCFKNVLAAKIAAIFGFAAINHHEQIGAIIFNDEMMQYIKPQRNRSSLLNIFNCISKPNSLKQNGGGLNRALQMVYKKLQAGSVVIVISDYFSFDETSQTYLNLIGRKSQVINILTYDILETKLPTNYGFYSFSNNEGANLSINASVKNNKLYQMQFNNRVKQLQLLQQPLIMVATNDNLVQQLNSGVFKTHGY
jgi:uncharacterized protein (DUF58 family)